MLVKAPATAFKLAADESQDDLAEGGEVLDMLSDTAPDEPVERLLPLSKEPLAPVEVAATTEPAPDRFSLPAPQIAAPSLAELPAQRTEPQSAGDHAPAGT